MVHQGVTMCPAQGVVQVDEGAPVFQGGDDGHPRPALSRFPQASHENRGTGKTERDSNA